MSIWHIAWGYLWNRKLPTVLTVASVALAVALISSVLTLRDETRKRFEEEGSTFDIVVGAKGSPMQLVLSTVYYMDTPTGNILFSEYERLRQHEEVVAAFPICLGDTYRGNRIVGTVRELFDHVRVDPVTREKQPLFRLKEGRYFEKKMEAVVGSTVARQNQLKLGDVFVGAHGFMDLPEDLLHVHAEFPYTVVGILDASGSPNDRAVFCDMESVYEVHKEGHHHHEEEEYHGPFRPGVEDTIAPKAEHEDEEGHVEAPQEKEVTAVLIDLESPIQQFQFKELVNSEYNAMAERPLNQIAKLYQQLLGTAKTVLLAIGYLVVVISALSILIGLYLSILQRKRDLAIMRALGASSAEILGSVMVEAFLVTVLGIGTGWLVGGGVSGAIGWYLADRYGLYVQPFGFSFEHTLAFGTVAFVGLLAGVIPAWQAYQTNVARDLAEL
ncbi:MAG TPA: ABC transporter permease [Candidatus Hydrogenedentes bacterium]|nr:ABC transporter permease [Candidatus Hydrogenedentota bacterium]HPG69158.1 ABC transporter permease [Candidatus Hydrogenedentota bacterium]